MDITLTRQQLFRLLVLAGLPSGVGMVAAQEEFSEVRTRTDLDGSLEKLGLLTGRAVLSPVAQTLLSPERALIAVKDQPETDRKTMYFHSRGTRLLVHYWQLDGFHRISTLSPRQMEELLEDWLPVHGQGNPDPKYFFMQEDQLEQIIQAVTGRQAPSDLSQVPSSFRRNLIESIQDREWSASFLHLTLQQGKAMDAFSFLAWLGGDGIWTAEGTELIHQLRVGNDTVNFQGLKRRAVRTLAGFGNSIRSYSLTPMELAFSFGVLNCGDAAGRVLSGQKTAPTDSRWKAAGASLHARGLSGISPAGFPFLVDDFEKAVVPLLLPVRTVKISVVTPQGVTESRLCLGQAGDFCMHFDKKNSHVLECGTESRLLEYLGRLFQDFGSTLDQTERGPIKISYRRLLELLDRKPGRRAKGRSKSAGPLSWEEELTQVLVQPAYRVSMLIEENTSSGTPMASTTRSLILLVKGRVPALGDWMFVFHEPTPEAEGMGGRVNRALFLKTLQSEISPAHESQSKV